MNYGDQTPADPIIPHTSYPSSPPSLEEPQASNSNGVVPLNRFPQVKLRIKFDTPNSVPQVMSNSVSYQYGNTAGDDEHDSGDDNNGFQFSGVDANAVRSQMDKEASDAANESEANNSNDEESKQRPKRDRKRRESDPASASSSAKKGKGGRARKAKEDKKVKKDEEEEDGEEEEEAGEVYEVERIIDHTLGEDGQILFKVKWLGYGAEYDTYEPESELGSAKQRINEYKKSLPVETRAELEKLHSGRNKKRGRPSAKASAKASKKGRVSLPAAASDASEEEKESEEDDDDDFALDDSKATSSTSRSRGKQTATRGGRGAGGRGRPAKNKAELKLFAVPTGVSPAKRPHVEARAQAWLDSESSDDEDTDSKKKEAKVKKEDNRSVSQSPAPSARRDALKKRGAKEVESTASNGARNASSSRAVAIEGVYRNGNGELDIVLTEGRAGQRIVPLREAHDLAGFKLVQFFVDRCQFNP